MCVYVREYEREDERKIKKKIIYHTRQRDGEGRKERASNSKDMCIYVIVTRSLFFDDYWMMLA